MAYPARRAESNKNTEALPDVEPSLSIEHIAFSQIIPAARTAAGFTTRQRSFRTCLLDECYWHIELANRVLTVRSTKEWITVRYDTSGSTVGEGVARHICQHFDLRTSEEGASLLTFRTGHRSVPR